MSTFRTASMPVPADEMQRARDQLASSYGARVWEAGGRRVLLVRVPRDDPDPVNDLEEAVEYLAASDAKDLTHLALIGNRRIEMVYPQPLVDRMAQRVQFDHFECTRLRKELMPHTHRIYTAAGDTRRMLRLALRIPHAKVAEVTDTDLDILSDAIGSELEGSKIRAVRAVYLIADQDHVRLDAELMVPDLRERYQDQDRKRRTLAEAARKAEEARRQREGERRKLMNEMERRFPPRVARAPLRSPEQGPWERDMGRSTTLTPRAGTPATAATAGRASPAPSGRPGEIRAPGARGPAAPPRAPRATTYDAIADRVDALARGGESARGQAMQPALSAPAMRDPALSPATPEATPEPSRAPSGIRAPAHARLADLGYEVLIDPPIEGHRADLAAERAEGYPQRVLAWFPERLTTAVAEEILAAAKDLGADLALAVAEAADPEAQRRLVATKGKWLRPQELSSLGL
jgi:hypothetical protein